MPGSPSAAASGARRPRPDRSVFCSRLPLGNRVEHGVPIDEPSRVRRRLRSRPRGARRRRDMHHLENLPMHATIEPGILYFGTPVVLVSTVNADGSFNLAPMSSAFWLGWRCMLGLAAGSKTPQNMRRTGECVLNLPSVDLVT